ncbi:MAG: DUF1573 domain-containing protein [Planctomycetota bacterium]
MKSGRTILIIGIIGCVAFLQGWLASQTLGVEPNSAAPATNPAPSTVEGQSPAPAEPNGPPPKISFEQPVHDFGLIGPGSTQTCEFNFKNEGVGTLIIKDVSKTCGCTVFTLEKKEYVPGEKGTLDVQYHADKGSGVRTRHLYVFSNDPDNPRIELTIKASITQKVAFEPDRLEYKLKGDNAGVAELTIRSVDEQPFSITKFDATNDAVTANFDPSQKGAKFVLKTRIDPQKMGASNNGRIEIAVSHPECPSITVPFGLLARFRVDPPAINLLNAEPGEKIQRELWVLDNYDEDFEIASVTSGQDIVKVVSREKLGRRYKLNLEIIPPATQKTARMFTDTLSLTTKDGEKINVTCRGFFRRR